VIRRDLGPDEALDYALQFGRGLDREKADTFVGMYVNDLTLEYGDRGRKAVQRLMDEAWEKRLIPKKVDVEFSA
jgi:1,4-dihydroxy-6-naphthoate synthase